MDNLTLITLFTMILHKALEGGNNFFLTLAINLPLPPFLKDHPSIFHV